MTERYVLVGLAGAGTPWFGRVSRWATEAVIPAEFVKTVSAEELRARLDTGRPFSAALLDGALGTVDRDLLDAVRRAGAAALVVTDSRVDRDWCDLGASATLDADFDRTQLVRQLATHARPVQDREVGAQTSPPETPRWQCPVVMVTGVPGTGRSTVATAIAQGLAHDNRRRPVALADFALDADLAMTLDAGDVVPGVQELVEAHRLGTPSVDTVRRLLFPIEAAGYDLLAGLREPTDWPVLRRGSTVAAVAGLRHGYRTLVIEADADLSGEHDTGSRDLEDHNALARAAAGVAVVVVIVGRGTVSGLHRLTRVTGRLVRRLPPDVDVVPVLNQVGRRDPIRGEARVALRTLAEVEARALFPPVFVRHHRQVDARVRDGAAQPRGLVGQLAPPIAARLDQRRPEPANEDAGTQPVVPGELGHWSEADEGNLSEGNPDEGNAAGEEAA